MNPLEMEKQEIKRCERDRMNTMEEITYKKCEFNDKETAGRGAQR
jgi:hypothetical protein